MFTRYTRKYLMDYKQNYTCVLMWRLPLDPKALYCHRELIIVLFPLQL